MRIAAIPNVSDELHGEQPGLLQSSDLMNLGVKRVQKAVVSMKRVEAPSKRNPRLTTQRMDLMVWKCFLNLYEYSSHTDDDLYDSLLVFDAAELVLPC